MKVSDYLAKFLKINGITTVFEMIGGMTAHIIDSIYNIGGIKIISFHHEQAAGFAAEGFARMTGIPGVALATSGPGATNLITAIGSCYFDSVPTIFITGQVNTYEQRKEGSNIRQLGFQETDIVSIVKPITKFAYKISDKEEIPHILKEAFQKSLEGRPGPVLIDIPMNIQREEIAEEQENDELSAVENVILSVNEDSFDELFTAIAKAKKPLILAGGGIRASNSQNELNQFVRSTGIPVVYSLMGWDAYTESQYRVGFIGSYGNRWANFALSECDLLIVLGSRLDVRQTGAQADIFSEGKIIFHVDNISDEINNRIKGCIPINLSLEIFFDVLFKRFQQKMKIHDASKVWLDRLNTLKLKFSDLKEIEPSNFINPNFLLKELSFKVDREHSYVTDVGQHQMWAAQSIVPKDNQRFITSGGMGAMGFALPTAIGMYFASMKPVYLIAGDGGFQCNIQELETIAKHNIPIKMLVMNNHSLGMVRQFQEAYFENRYQSTVWGYSAPSFHKVANAYGIASSILNDEKEIVDRLEWFVKDDSPKLLEVKIDTNTPVNPKLTYGQPLSNMTPTVN